MRPPAFFEDSDDEDDRPLDNKPKVCDDEPDDNEPKDEPVDFVDEIEPPPNRSSIGSNQRWHIKTRVFRQYLLILQARSTGRCKAIGGEPHCS